MFDISRLKNFARDKRSSLLGPFISLKNTRCEYSPLLFFFLKTRTFHSPNCGLYYKDVTIVNYNSSIVNKFGASLIDDIRVIIYDHHMFIVQAGNTKGGTITVLLTSCLTGLD